MAEKYTQNEFDQVKKEIVDVFQKKDSPYQGTLLEKMSTMILQKTELTGDEEKDRVRMQTRESLWGRLRGVLESQQPDKIRDHIKSILELSAKIDGHGDIIAANLAQEMLEKPAMKAMLEKDKNMVKVNIILEFNQNNPSTEKWNTVLEKNAQSAQQDMQESLNGLQTFADKGGDIDDMQVNPERLGLVHAHMELLNTYYSNDNLRTRAIAVAIDKFLIANHLKGGSSVASGSIPGMDLNILSQCYRELQAAKQDPLAYLESARQDFSYASTHKYIFPELRLEKQLTQLSGMKPLLAEQFYKSISQEHARISFRNGFVAGAGPEMDRMVKILADTPGLVWDFSYGTAVRGNTAHAAAESFNEAAETNLAGRALKETWEALNAIGKTAADSFTAAVWWDNPEGKEQFLQDMSEDKVVETCAQYLNWEAISKLIDNMTPEQKGALAGKVTTDLVLGLLTQLGASKLAIELPEFAQLVKLPAFKTKLVEKVGASVERLKNFGQKALEDIRTIDLDKPSMRPRRYMGPANQVGAVDYGPKPGMRMSPSIIKEGALVDGGGGSLKNMLDKELYLSLGGDFQTWEGEIYKITAEHTGNAASRLRVYEVTMQRLFNGKPYGKPLELTVNGRGETHVLKGKNSIVHFTFSESQPGQLKFEMHSRGKNTGFQIGDDAHGSPEVTRAAAPRTQSERPQQANREQPRQGQARQPEAQSRAPKQSLEQWKTEYGFNTPGNYIEKTTSQNLDGAMMTHNGIGYKPRNEDSIFFDAVRQEVFLADGMGGHSNGDKASQLLAKYVKGRPSGMSVDQAVMRAHQEIQKLYPDAGTTMAHFAIKGRTLEASWVADSRIIVIDKQGVLKFISKDGGLVNNETAGAVRPVINKYGVRTNLPQEDLNLPGRNIVTEAIGIDELPVLNKAKVPLDAGDTVVIGSDGIFDNFNSNELAAYVQGLKADGANDRQISMLLSQKILNGMKNKTSISPSTNKMKSDNVSFGLFTFKG